MDESANSVRTSLWSVTEVAEARRPDPERILERIRQDPAAKLFSVSQNDCLNFCTCAACKEIDTREGSHAGTMISFVNQVAEAVEREFPDVWIETLAYNETRTPPKTVRPRHNVVVRLCSIECEFSKPVDRSGAGQNKKFVDEMNFTTQTNDSFDVFHGFSGHSTAFFYGISSV